MITHVNSYVSEELRLPYLEFLGLTPWARLRRRR